MQVDSKEVLAVVGELEIMRRQYEAEIVRLQARIAGLEAEKEDR